MVFLVATFLPFRFPWRLCPTLAAVYQDIEQDNARQAKKSGKYLDAIACLN
jgi:hypothetical protein